MRLIGFSHGTTYKISNPYTKENINLFKKCGCNAIEINYYDLNDLDKLYSLEEYIGSFKYKSIHMPGLRYRDDETTNNLLVNMASYYDRIGARLAVVHPDQIEDISVFNKYPTINWAIENMDDKKDRYKNLKDLKHFFEINPLWSLTLDLGHCKANDKTMKLADDIIIDLKNKIKEIHLSGYEILHEPLYRTKQVEIIERCNTVDAPIIIESTFEEIDGKAGIAKEFDYILKNLR